MSDTLFTLAQAAQALDAPFRGTGAATFSRVTTDSRDVQPGDLFVALKGDRFDGHDFVADVLARGAVGAMVEADHPVLATLATDAPLIEVVNTTAGLGRLASRWRLRFGELVLIGVTGSSGKTTLKEMIAAILRTSLMPEAGASDMPAQHAGDDAVLATEGNLNNHIGMPLMLLRLRAHHRFAVIEMGMNHFGEIAYLTGLARPNVAVINNAGTAHIEHLGSRQGIAKAKGEIFAGLTDDGVAVINRDDDFAAYWDGLTGRHRRIGFGLTEGDVIAEGLITDALESRFALVTPSGLAPVVLPAPGLHNVRNALAAAAVCHALGLSPDDIARGLSAYRGIKGRLQQKRAANGALVLDDSYNANPDSMRAAVDVLTGLPGERWLVLGDMGEIDEVAVRHADIGHYARGKGLAGLYATGEGMRHAVAAYGEGACWFDSHAALVAALNEQLTPTASVLVKGSRFMRMEQVVEALASNPDKGGA
jgi:UDP-N-acetylmuramoyl-tripeptide--D-alanyl-D-alanine ligase